MSALPAVSDRPVPGHRSLMPIKDTIRCRILSPRNSRQRLQALNGDRTEQNSDFSFRLVGFRNGLVGENPPRIKENSSHKGDRANTAYRCSNPTRN
jgi:hypothetical protein